MILDAKSQKNEKICGYKKKLYLCRRKRVIIYSLKIENYVRNFE